MGSLRCRFGKPSCDCVLVTRTKTETTKSTNTSFSFKVLLILVMGISRAIKSRCHPNLNAGREIERSRSLKAIEKIWMCGVLLLLFCSYRFCQDFRSNTGHDILVSVSFLLLLGCRLEAIALRFLKVLYS